MTLVFAATHELGDFTLDASFTSSGRLTALFGPSGSGKSTVTNMIAGLLRPEQARIEIDGRVLTHSAAGIFVPVHRRRIGYVFQDARLFPHLTVRQNLLYGRYFAPRSDRQITPVDVIDLLGIGHLLSRRPGALSGGERQRIAIGRALLASPRLILMDEPLASLDEARKNEILPFIERLRDEAGVPIVYVSHAMAEVARLATDAVILREGKVVASGRASDVLEQMGALGEDGRDEAGVLLDLEVLPGDTDGIGQFRSAAGLWRLPRSGLAPGAHVRARVRARDVILAIEKPSGISALNIHAGTVERVAEGAGPEALVRVACGGEHILARVTRYSVAALGLTPGTPVFAIVKAVSFADRNQPRSMPREG